MENELKEQLNNLNKELETERNNLIYCLCNMDIKDINILNFHFRINEILNKIDYIRNQIFYNSNE